MRLNYLSMLAIIYDEPRKNLRAWENLYQINQGIDISFSPEDYILIPFPSFHNYLDIVRVIKPNDIMEYNTETGQYSEIVDDKEILDNLVNSGLLSAYIGQYGNSPLICDIFHLKEEMTCIHLVSPYKMLNIHQFFQKTPFNYSTVSILSDDLARKFYSRFKQLK